MLVSIGIVVVEKCFWFVMRSRVLLIKKIKKLLVSDHLAMFDDVFNVPRDLKTIRD